MGKKVAIYILVDPRDNTVRYVGKSKCPKQRLKGHLNAARHGGSRRTSRWIRKLLNEGRQPRLAILEWVDEFKWEEAERKWIAYYRAIGADLSNHTDGGDGVHNPDAESRKRLSKTRKRLWRDNAAFREKMLSVIRSEQRREKISMALSGKPKSAEHVAKLPQNNKGFRPNLSKETRRLYSERMIGNQHAAGKTHSEETKQKISEALRGRKYPFMFEPRTRQSNLKRSETLRGQSKTDEHKKRIANGIKQHWQNNPPPKGWGSWARIDWPDYEWLEEQLKTKTMKELASELGVKVGTLSAKLYRERKKTERKRQ